MDEYEVIVLGSGAMGSAATYQLAKRGIKTLGIDQFSPPHHLGSSHGDTRITRLAIGEGSHYLPLVKRSHDIWRELEQETGKMLLKSVGGLIISSGSTGTVNHVEEFFERTVAVAKEHGISHELLDASGIRSRFPQFNVQDNESGYFEHEAGFVHPEACIEAQQMLAKQYGAEFHTNEKVRSFEEDATGVRVTTDQATYHAKKLIVTAGPWIPEFVDKEYKQYFKVFRQTLFWFAPNDAAPRFDPSAFPVFIWELQNGKQAVYGFPAIDEHGVKIASELYETETTADTVNRDVTEQEVKDMYEHFVKPYFPDLSSRCTKAVSCLYTVTPDAQFVIDRHPRMPSVIIASPCSGHGFKHSAAVGELLAGLVTGEQSFSDISQFSLKRFTQ